MHLAPGMRAIVIGLGAAGLSTLRYLRGRGVEVAVSEGLGRETVRAETLAWLEEEGIALETGGHSEAFFVGADCILPSPGVPLDLPVLAGARRRGVPVLGELALAAGQFAAPVIAVTGSNGKTTVTSLIGALLRESGRKPFVGGNIGTPLLEYFAHPDDYDAVVLELSSFQLDLSGDFRPDIGLLLNISPDHLDRHGSLAAYAGAKMRIFAHQRAGDFAILGTDDSLLAEAQLPPGPALVAFGTGEGCAARVSRGQVWVRPQAAGQAAGEVYDLRETALHSRVNQLNAAAAILAADLCGCPAEAIRAGLARFTPPPHRMAEVAAIGGIRFIDDSKATNIGALQAALGCCDGPVLLIAGGRDKGGDYRLLREVVRAKVKGLLLLGEAAGLMREALETVTSTELVADMEEAVRRAMALAAPGDTVLLAPGCSSFDMFSGYAERGRAFAACVRALAEC